jgi:hypothetical protein
MQEGAKEKDAKSVKKSLLWRLPFSPSSVKSAPLRAKF